MTETLDQSILEDKLEESAEERHFAREERKVDAAKLSLGLSVGLGVLASGIVLITYGGFGSLRWLAAGFLFLPLGLWITMSVGFGGLGPSGAYRLRSYRNLRFWWGWIRTRDQEEEGSKKAEPVEASEEDDETKEQRRKNDFD